MCSIYCICIQSYRPVWTTHCKVDPIRLIHLTKPGKKTVYLNIPYSSRETVTLGSNITIRRRVCSSRCYRQVKRLFYLVDGLLFALRIITYTSLLTYAKSVLLQLLVGLVAEALCSLACSAAALGPLACPSRNAQLRYCLNLTLPSTNTKNKQLL